MDPIEVFDRLQTARASLVAFGAPFQAIMLIASVIVAVMAFLPQARRWRGWAITFLTALLVVGTIALSWFHIELYRTAVVVDPERGAVTGSVAVPLWIESGKLYIWALAVALLGAAMRRQRKELLPGVMLAAASLTFGAALLGRPFTDPVPGFIGQYSGYLQAMSAGGGAAAAAFQGMEGARQFYYNAWYMWVHPPLLFLSYGCFAISFVATLKMMAERHSSFETTAYRWARLGYLPLTFGMLLGFPWAILAWSGESWWWSGKVNMSIMMWLLYTAYLHARLYLRRRSMWKLVAALSVLSFTILVLTYVTTYVVPGAHSYAAAPAGPWQAVAALLMAGVGGGS